MRKRGSTKMMSESTKMMSESTKMMRQIPLSGALKCPVHGGEMEKLLLIVAQLIANGTPAMSRWYGNLPIRVAAGRGYN